MDNFIPVNEPLLNGNEKKYLNECIDTGWISSEGHFVKKLEDDFSAYCGLKYGSAVCNGSVAIDVAVRSLKELYNWKDGDEIIMTSFTIISCAQSVIYNGLKPVFVDCEPLTYNIDVNKIEEMINNKTKAIMIVHIYGMPSDMNPIMDIANKYNLVVLEDSAEAHGQTYRGKKCGSFGEISTFSFYPNKHLTTGEGGMIVTSNKDLADKCNYFKNLCFTPENRFVNNDLGWNFRMSNLQAAVGVAQFERISEFIEIKKNMGKRYIELLTDIPAKLPIEKLDYAENNFWVFPIVLNDEIKLTGKDAIKKLAEKGIGCRPFFYPLHKQPILQKMGLTDNIIRPVSERLYNKGFYIPSGLNLTDEKMVFVSKKVKELF